MTATMRERFHHALLSGPLLSADAIVVFCGEDAVARCDVAAQLFKQGAASRLFVTGGLDQPPRIHGAVSCSGMLMGHGIAPDRITLDLTAMHTWDQAVVTTERAKAEGWKRVILTASSYHLPRAYLSLLGALIQAGLSETVRVVAMPAGHAPFAAPPGMTATRDELLSVEYDKMDRYVEHVASYADGLANLRYWEGK